MLGVEELGAQIRVASHQSTLPYNSYARDTEEIKAYYAIVMDNCTDDEATYLSAKETVRRGLISTLIEDCWKQYQENGKRELVKKFGVTALRNMDGSIIRYVPVDVWYGFETDRDARRYMGNRKRVREE